jgi:hypothetical protein
MRTVPMMRLAAVLLLGALAAGCMTTRAQAPIERPALEVPPAPPRVIEQAPPPEVLPQPQPVEDLPPPPAIPTPPRRSPRENGSREAQKPEPKADALPAVTEPQVAAAPAQPAPVLRTPATADAAASERQIRDTLGRAQAGLNNVNYQQLSQARKKAYDEAKDFITSAEGAIKAANFEIAKEFADKAEKLARVLQGS